MDPNEILVCMAPLIGGHSLIRNRIYMLDGIYQSLICFFMPYLLFAPTSVVTSNGLNVNDRERFGVFVACATVVVVNVYILLNTYRWDWLILLLVGISILLVWFWTGVYTAFVSSEQFYKAATEVYGELTFWAVSLLIIIICLLPRFASKAFQKIYLPRDIDIVREQVRQGKFNYLDDPVASEPKSKTLPGKSSDMSKSKADSQTPAGSTDDDKRPIYPPSIAQTSTTHNPRSQTGSDGTDYTSHRMSLEPPQQRSLDRPRHSFDRMRLSMGDVRPSFEASNDFTSAALLTRMESNHSQTPSRQTPHGTSSLR